MKCLILPFCLVLTQIASGQFKELFSEAMEVADYQRAIEITERWKQEDSTNTEVYYYSAKALSIKGQRKEARVDLEMALTLDSLHIPSLLSLAQLRKSSNLDVLPIYEKLILADPDNPYFYREAAETAMERAKIEKAFAYYDLAFKLDSTYAMTVGGLANLYLKMKQPDTADSLLSLAIELDPENLKFKLLKAKLSFDAERYEKAISWIGSNPAMYGSSILPLRILGISHYHLGNYDKALEFLRSLSNVATDLDYPHYYMGLCLEKTGQTERAEVQYGQALNKALSPNLGAYYERLGLMKQINGDHAVAIDNFQMARKFSARNEILFHLAKSYDVYYEDRSIALKSFEEFVAKAEPSEEVNYAKARISQLKKESHFRDE